MNTPTLYETLQDLINICGQKDVRLTLKVPAEVLGRLSQTLAPTERIKLFGSIDKPTFTIGSLYLRGGIVDFEANDT